MTGREKLKIWLVMTVIWLCFSSIATAVERHVPSQYSTIQAAINAAVDGDEVVVADGVYRGKNNYNIDLQNKIIVLRSANGPGSCIIDCEGRQSSRGFYLDRAARTDTVIDGFTIKNGNAQKGGGIYLYYCGPIIKNCIISNNSGGGIYCEYGSPRITNCIIINNSATFGGGVFIGISSSPKIMNCTIVGNLAIKWGGGISIVGGRDVFISNCIFHANACHAVYEIHSNSDPNVDNCFFGYNPDGDYFDYDTDLTLNGAEQINTLPEANNNISGSDPMFAFGDDYHLMPDSPCIDEGTNDPCGTLLTIDIEGNVRPLDGEGDGYAVADIGAYEYCPNMPAIGLTPCELFFRRDVNAPNPSAQTLYIRNTSEGTLNWEVDYDCPWLEVEPKAGDSNGEVDQVEVRVDSKGLSAGGHICFLKISDSSASNSPRKVLIRFHVGGTLYVPQQYTTIQEAIDDAMNGDTVLVSDGVYAGERNRNLRFWGKAITLKSGNGPNHCAIDCGWSGSAILFFSNGDANPVIDGFTMRRCKGVIECYGSSAEIRNCVFTNNQSDAIIYVSVSNLTLANCSIIDNEDVVAVHCAESHVDIKNCTIFNNNASGGIYCNREGIVRITNTILWGNYPQEIDIKSGSVTATHSCIQGSWPGEGNIDINPFLTANGHLQSISPCIDICETGPSNDLDGETRPIGIAFDIGSDEFLDLDNDGLPNWWEIKFFGSNIAADPNDDFDADDNNNLEEYIMGTNPLGPYYVDGTNGNDTWDGCAAVWDGFHGPKSTIQAAIDATHNGDTITIADGIYSGYSNRDIDFNGKAIIVTSVNGPENCIIDCQAAEGYEHRGFYFHTSEDSNSVLNSLTITNGVAFNGGGIYCEHSSPTIKDCKIIGNYSRWRSGGGIYCDHSRPQISGCIIRENIADDSGGGVYCEDGSNAVISNCIISDNQAAGTGGGVISCYASKVLLKDCTIARNHAGRNGGGLGGSHDSPVLINCMIVENSSDGWGGGFYVSDSPNFTIENCTIANNLATQAGGIYIDFYMSVQLSNSILYWNFPNQMTVDYHSSAIVDYTDIEGGQHGVDLLHFSKINWGKENILDDPLFVDSNNPDLNIRDYHLLPHSPCIDAGDPNSEFGLEPEPDGGRINMGAYGNTPEATSKGGLVLQSYNLVNKSRVGRTVFEYEFTVTLNNNGSEDVSNVLLELLDASGNVEIIDSEVNFAYIEAGEVETSEDTFSLRVDRASAIDAATISWRATFEYAGGGAGVAAFTNNIILEDIAGDITGEGAVDIEDLARLAERWLWVGQVGEIAEDIAPSPYGDGTVNWLDFAKIAEKWGGYLIDE